MKIILSLAILVLIAQVTFAQSNPVITKSKNSAEVQTKKGIQKQEKPALKINKRTHQSADVGKINLESKNKNSRKKQSKTSVPNDNKQKEKSTLRSKLDKQLKGEKTKQKKVKHRAKKTKQYQGADR